LRHVFRFPNFRGAFALIVGFAALAWPAHAQAPDPLAEGQSYWKARFAFFSPDGSHLLATLCHVKAGRCRPWRYYFAERRWEQVVLTPDDPLWSIDSATYSPDGKTIAATQVSCTGDWRRLSCPYDSVALTKKSVWF
jgi:hypothetical protein